MPTSTPYENPLVPNRKLRALYIQMAQLRLLDRHIANIQAATLARSRSRAPVAKLLPSIFGEEACRVATTINLTAGDLTSDPNPAPLIDHLRGIKLPEILHRAYALSSHFPSGRPQPQNHRLPCIGTTIEQLNIAFGAALALRSQPAAKSKQAGKVVVAFMYSENLTSSEWRPLLEQIGTHPAPLLLVALPALSPSAPGYTAGALSAIATRSGVPGMVVDHADPVAIYRVAEESIARARAGGGATLIECVRYTLPTRPKLPSDPLETLRRTLLDRELVTASWCKRVESAFLKRLNSAER